MICICQPKMLSAWSSLQALMNLNVAVPMPPAQLLMLAGGPAGVSATAMAEADLALMLNLPPLDLRLVAQIKAAAMAAAQLKSAFGIDVCTPGGVNVAAQLAQSLQLNLPRLPLPQAALPNLACLLNLTAILAMTTAIQSSFGINLMVPMPYIHAALQAAILAKLSAAGVGTGLNANMSASAMAQMQAYADLALAARLLGGIPNLIPSLRLMARLQASLNGGLMMAMINFSTMAQVSAALRATLGLGISPHLQAQLQLALAPLAVNLAAIGQLSFTGAGTGGGASLSAGAQLALDAILLAQVNVGTLMGLNWSAYPALAFAASFAVGVTANAACEVCLTQKSAVAVA